MNRIQIIDHSKPISGSPEPYCVYSISFLGSHKRYIGSTIQWPLRINSHLGRLRAGKHANKYLQRAFAKYGEDKMRFGIVERPSVNLGHENLLNREGFWIKLCRAADRKYGYNLESVPSKGGVKGINCKTFVLYDKDNNRIIIDNLKQFCSDRGLDYQKMHKAISGYSIQYQGWKGDPNRKPIREKFFRLRSPSGEVFEGYGVRQFCVERRLPFVKMYRVLKGLTQHCDGWSCPDVKAIDNRAKSYTLQGPENQIILVKNLKQWHKTQNFGVSYEMLTQGRTSKGWKIKERHG